MFCLDNCITTIKSNNSFADYSIFFASESLIIAQGEEEQKRTIIYFFLSSSFRSFSFEQNSKGKTSFSLLSTALRRISLLFMNRSADVGGR